MKDKKDIKNNQGELYTAEVSSVKYIIEELKKLLENSNIAEDGLRRVLNVSREFENLKESYMWRIIKLMKQNHMMD